MKRSLQTKVFILICMTGLVMSCRQSQQIASPTQGEAYFEQQILFTSERFPNLVVAKNGTLVATWGSEKVVARRSEDGGLTWGPEIVIAKSGIQGGGTTVDESTGNIFVFVEEGHPPCPVHVYMSKDHGKTWQEHTAKILPDKQGNQPSMHMNEHGITLQHGKYKGRLMRPARYYGVTNERSEWPKHYTNAIYSDDGGDTWQSSEPFPAYGTGEAAIAELSDGTLYYNSRRHLSTDGLNPRMRHIAWSQDGGATWENLSVSDELPDGAQFRDYGLMGGLVRLPIDNQDVLLYSNIISSTEKQGRSNGHVWISFDGGKTWPHKKLIDAGSFAYSSLNVGRPGTAGDGFIYLLYESKGGAKLARFNLEWLLDGKAISDFIHQ
jgi:sialidase-1